MLCSLNDQLEYLAQPIIITILYPFVTCDKIKAQTQLDVDLDKMKKWLIECLAVVV